MIIPQNMALIQLKVVYGFHNRETTTEHIFKILNIKQAYKNCSHKHLPQDPFAACYDTNMQYPTIEYLKDTYQHWLFLQLHQC